MGTLRLCGASLHSLQAAPFSRERRGARVRSAGIICWVARKRAPTPCGSRGWSKSACGRGTLGTLRLCGASLHSLQAAPFSRERRGARVRSAGIICWVARKRAPTPCGSRGWSKSACGRGALGTLRLCGASLHSLQAAPFSRERRGARVRSAGIICWVARKRAPTPCGSRGWSRSACGRGALGTLRLCGASLHSLQAAPFSRERRGARVRSAGIICWVARKRAPTPCGSRGWSRSVCGRGALGTLRLCGASLHSLQAAPFSRERRGARVRSAGIICWVARKRAPTPCGSRGWSRSVCGRGALGTLRLCGASLHSLQAAPFSRERRGARVRSAGIICWVARKRAPMPCGSRGWSRSACGRGALGTLRLCGASLHSLQAAPFSRERRGARVRSAGIICWFARKRAPTPCGSRGWSRSACGRGALGTLRL